MSLANRLNQVVAIGTNNGCHTCKYLETLKPSDREAFNVWIREGHSARQLWHLCTTDRENPLKISITGFRNHLMHHVE